MNFPRTTVLMVSLLLAMVMLPGTDWAHDGMVALVHPVEGITVDGDFSD